jgi:hypothetical protein
MRDEHGKFGDTARLLYSNGDYFDRQVEAAIYRFNNSY